MGWRVFLGHERTSRPNQKWGATGDIVGVARAGELIRCGRIPAAAFFLVCARGGRLANGDQVHTMSLVFNLLSQTVHTIRPGLIAVRSSSHRERIGSFA